MRRLALVVVVLLLLAAPGEALAQFGVPFPIPAQEDYGPGITTSGVGFAPLGQRARATGRAVADARRRADAIAAALGVSLGDMSAAEVSSPFDPRPECRNSTRRRCAPLEAMTVEATFAIAGGPTSEEEGAREITGTGVGAAPVEAERKTSPAVRHALRAARLAATPGAAETARANAEAAAGATGIPLGPLFSVADIGSAYGYDPVAGAYGPGQYCIRRRTLRIRFDPETNTRRVIRGKRHVRCFKPSRLTVRLEATYLGG
jgi:uncharacterized protein DUF541